MSERFANVHKMMLGLYRINQLHRSTVKLVINGHPKRRPIIGFQDRLSLKETKSVTMNTFRKKMFFLNHL